MPRPSWQKYGGSVARRNCMPSGDASTPRIKLISQQFFSEFRPPPGAAPSGAPPRSTASGRRDSARRALHRRRSWSQGGAAAPRRAARRDQPPCAKPLGIPPRAPSLSGQVYYARGTKNSAAKTPRVAPKTLGVETRKESLDSEGRTLSHEIPSFI